MEWKELLCIDKNGEPQKFYYLIENPDKNYENVWDVYVSNEPTIVYDIFQVTLKPLDDCSVYISMITSNKNKLFSGMGIPEFLLPQLELELNKRIFSSKKYTNSGEFRTEDAEKMWLRLVDKGIASYSDLQDRYYLKNP